MPMYAFEGLAPRVDPEAFIAPTATLVGDVVVEAGASVWYGAIVRADYAPVVVRAGANVQDNAVVHGSPGLTTDIGPGATVGHGCVIRGAFIGADAVISYGAVVLEAARIGAGALVAAGSVVGANTEIPAGFLATGTPARVKRPVAGSGAELWASVTGSDSEDLAHRHRVGIELIG